MNSAQLVTLMNALRSMQKTQQEILNELKKLNEPIKVGVEELNYDDVGYTPRHHGNIGG